MKPNQVYLGKLDHMDINGKDKIDIEVNKSKNKLERKF